MSSLPTYVFKILVDNMSAYKTYLDVATIMDTYRRHVFYVYEFGCDKLVTGKVQISKRLVKILNVFMEV